MLRQCLGSASAVEEPPTAIPRRKHGQAKIDQKITTYDHVHQIFITWLRDLDVEFCVTGALGTSNLVNQDLMNE